jgi:hypothetical protein
VVFEQRGAHEPELGVVVAVVREHGDRVLGDGVVVGEGFGEVDDQVEGELLGGAASEHVVVVVAAEARRVPVEARRELLEPGTVPGVGAGRRAAGRLRGLRGRR